MPGINVEIGGFVVKLVCHDSALERRIKSAFHCLPRNQKPIMTLAVHSAASASHNDFDLPAGKYLDGEGEYVASFDPAARHGVIRLTGSTPVLALANFIRRIFARLVIDNKGAVFHSACVVRKGGAYIFFGKSGSGKSTVCELSQGYTIASHALRVASDDLTAVRAVNGRLLAWGLPAFRAPPYQLSRGVFPVRAAFILAKDSRNFIKRLKATAAIAGMLSFPADLSNPEQVGKIVDLLTRLVHNVPCYELHFSKNREFWDEIDAMVHSPRSTVHGK